MRTALDALLDHPHAQGGAQVNTPLDVLAKAVPAPLHHPLPRVVHT
ncbi:hypothetical protein C8D88_11852 [Lentzea atacamensis]|uniref:Uncharacterized protein n=1 Tax=Lentzea atacamensis TaxID=531938 RepID=A0A316HSI8_9PSEU|nr:hypothetical protein [Lentzea atacamensis]PWK81284.1 hypothetical protein C8D88_11852 [Lentzea atacamensis]